MTVYYNNKALRSFKSLNSIFMPNIDEGFVQKYSWEEARLNKHRTKIVKKYFVYNLRSVIR